MVVLITVWLLYTQENKAAVTESPMNIPALKTSFLPLQRVGTSPHGLLLQVSMAHQPHKGAELLGWRYSGTGSRYRRASAHQEQEFLGESLRITPACSMLVGFHRLLLFRGTDWTCPTSTEVLILKHLHDRNWGCSERECFYCICCQRDVILRSPAQEAHNPRGEKQHSSWKLCALQKRPIGFCQGKS